MSNRILISIFVFALSIAQVALADPTGQHAEGIQRSNVNPERCGDGIIQASRGEQCDNGDFNNGKPGDPCDSTCHALAVCGNGALEVGELCDEGIENNGNSAHLITLAGYQGDLYCSPTCQIAGCGSKTVDPGEDCDFGDHLDGDGCDQNCRVEECGNGVAQNGEACDNGDAWDGSRPPNGVRPLEGMYNGCNSNCSIPVCGNEAIEPAGDEDCDFGGQNGLEGINCTNNCKFVSVCGDGEKQLGESCDKGLNNGNNSFRFTVDGAEYWCSASCNLVGCTPGGVVIE